MDPLEINLNKKTEGEVRVVIGEVTQYSLEYLGSQLVYNSINNVEFAFAERTFLPDLSTDSVLSDYIGKIPVRSYRDKLRGFGLKSLETKKPVKKANILAFTICSPKQYINQLLMMDLAGIPLLSEERDLNQYPLVIAGGIGVSNPAPISKFVDAFVLGDGEYSIRKILGVYKKHKSSKQELLRELSKVEGVFVPSFYDFEYNAHDGRIKDISIKESAPKHVKHDQVKDINKIRSASIVMSDEALLQTDRGCPYKCTFCEYSHANPLYRNLTMQSIEDYFKQFLSLGIKKVRVVSASPSTNPNFLETNRLARRMGLKMWYPTFRPDDLDEEKINSLQSNMEFSLSPDVGNDKLRYFLRKRFKNEDFKKALNIALEKDFEKYVFYGIINIPNEDKTDLDDFVWLMEYAQQRISRTNRETEIRYVLPLIPCPNTPIERDSMVDYETYLNTFGYLHDLLLEKTGIEIKPLRMDDFIAESLLKRGDSRLGEILLESYLNYDFSDDDGKLYKIIKSCFDSKEPRIYNPMQGFNENMILPWEILKLRK